MANPMLTQPNVIQCTRASMRAALEHNDPTLLIHNRTGQPLIGLRQTIAAAAAPVATPKHSDPVLAAMLALEVAIIDRAATVGSTPEYDKAFLQYQKAKALALNPGTMPEGIAAARVALLTAIKLVF
jgi:hypothetical protein